MDGLTPAWTPLRPHRQQFDLWTTKARFVAAAAGRGSGKTEIARRRIVRMLAVKKPWPNPLYFYALPTFPQAKRVAWEPILSLIPPGWIEGEPNRTELSITTIFGSKLYIVGTDKPQRLEGVQWDGGIVDEAGDTKPGTFERSILPALSHRNGWCWKIGVPKRFGIGASDFKTFFDKTAEESYTWPSSDILTPEQLQYAMENLDADDYNEQYNASWVSARGAIFYSFSDANILPVEYDPNRPLVIGSDFNVDPMSWIIGQIVNNKLFVFDEIFMRNTNTEATLDRLWEKYGLLHNHEWIFIGDAAASQRKTSAAKSDYLLIKGDKRFAPKRVIYPKANPARADRFASTNAKLRNALKELGVYINPRCIHLLHDLAHRSFKPGTNEPDDSHGDSGHMTDALGYVIHKLWPIRVVPHVKAPIYARAS